MTLWNGFAAESADRFDSRRISSARACARACFLGAQRRRRRRVRIAAALGNDRSGRRGAGADGGTRGGS